MHDSFQAAMLWGTKEDISIAIIPQFPAQGSHPPRVPLFWLCALLCQHRLKAGLCDEYDGSDRTCLPRLIAGTVASTFSPGSLTLEEAGSHVMRTLKQPYGELHA